MTGRASGDAPATETGEEQPVLSVRNLRKSYESNGTTVTAVDGISFSVSSGNIVGLLGHNGAGKTTTIKMILGIVTPSEGTVLIDGRNIRDHPTEAYKSVAAVLEGARNIYWRLTVRENLDFFARLGGLSPNERADYHDRLLAQLDLDARADTVVNELSRGMKQKVSLAAMLAREPDLLFLDEPTLGLDIESSLSLRREIRRLVDTEDMTVVVSSHDMDVIEQLCDRVIILNDGEIAVDDSITNLRELFQSRDLELTIGGSVPDGFRASLESEHDVESWSTRDDRTRISLRVRDGEEIQRVVSRVLETGLRIVDVQTTRTDMEEIYLDVTRGDDERRRDEPVDPLETHA